MSNIKIDSDPVSHFAQVHREHAAWRQLCLQLTELDVNINSEGPLACAIRLWGEELHALRLGDPSHDEKALREKREEYEPHWIQVRP